MDPIELKNFGYAPDPAKLPGDKVDSSFSDLRPQLLEIVPGDIDLRKYATVTNQFSLPSCFPSGTQILMANGEERAIEDVAGGNEVLSHEGHSRCVTDVFRRKYSGVLYTLKVKGWAYPLKVTAEHPIAVIRNALAEPRFRAGNLEWVLAKEVEPRDHVVMVPLRSEATVSDLKCENYIEGDIWSSGGQLRLSTAKKSHCIPNTIPLSTDFARLVGLFLAEGSFGKFQGSPVQVNLTFARHERDLQDFCVQAFDSIFGVKASVVDPPTKGTVSNVEVYNATLARFLHNFCGEYAAHKRLPSVFFKAPKEVRLALLRGWLQGDGSHNPIRTHGVASGRPRSISSEGNTSSIELHRGLFHLAMSVGLKPSTSTRKQESHQNYPSNVLAFYSREVFEVFPEYLEKAEELGVSPNGSPNHKVHELGVLCRVQSVEKEYVEDIDVFNLEVEGEHTYVAEGLAVHNCVGNSTADSIEILSAAQGFPQVELSRMFVWTLARTLMAEKGYKENTGTYIRLAFQVLHQFGICLEKYWPYDELRWDRQPSLRAMQKATSRKIKGYYRIDSAGHARVEDVISALQAEHPVVFGTLLDDQWSNYNGRDTLQKPKGSTKGGHAMVAVGYDSSKGFIVKNSWGPNWGDRGYCYVSEDYMDWRNTWDIWVPTMGHNFK